MVALQVFLTVFYVIGVNGVKAADLQAPDEENRSPAETEVTPRRIAQFDSRVIRTLKNIDYEERHAMPGMMFSLASLEMENCTEICQGGDYLSGSCGMACRAHYGELRQKSSIRELRQSDMEQDQKMSELYTSIIIAFAFVIVTQSLLIAFLLCKLYKHVNQSDQQITDDCKNRIAELEKKTDKKFQDMSDQKKIGTPESDHTALTLTDQVITEAMRLL